jgi:single-stranded-DNA-specific exonuclease
LTVSIRLFPVWEFLYRGPYESVVDALVSGRALDLAELDVGPDSLHAPELLTDLARGAERLEQAIRSQEQILVFGDYDVDGVVSTTLMMDFLGRVGARCSCMLPNRHTDGYGIKPPAIARAASIGVQLIVTVDNGIAANEAIALAGQAGMDVIVLDHHQQHGELPPAHSVINPNRRDCEYPFKGLAGVGVAFKFVQAVSQAFMSQPDRRSYLNGLLDLVALGTIADVAPVLGENRVFIRRGLEILRRPIRPGLRQLKEVAGYADQPLDTTAIGYHLGPRLNVAGRLSSAQLALDLLTATDDETAASLAVELDTLNGKRRQLQSDGTDEAKSYVEADELATDKLLVVLGESWHLGIIGLLASGLAGKFHRPVVVCTGARDDGTYTGSARSIPGYDIGAGVNHCAEHLLSHGGHPGAAGLTLSAEKFEAFRVDLIAHANEHLADADLEPKLTVDLALCTEDICVRTVNELEQLEPFGTGNQRPIFATEQCEVTSCRRIGRDRSHGKIGLKVGSVRSQALWWNRGDMVDRLRVGQKVAVAYSLERDTYTGNGAVQLVVQDMYAHDE